MNSRPAVLPEGVRIIWEESDPHRRPTITHVELQEAIFRVHSKVSLDPHPPLGIQERADTILMAAGLEVPEIADYTYRSHNTVKTELRHAYAKLGGARRLAARQLFRKGILQPLREPRLSPEDVDPELRELLECLDQTTTYSEADKVWQARGKRDPDSTKALTQKWGRRLKVRGGILNTWGYAAGALLVPPEFKQYWPIEPFRWHRTEEGFAVRIFDDAYPAAELHYEGRYSRVRKLTDIAIGTGRLSVHDTFFGLRGEEKLDVSELSALAVVGAGGQAEDLTRFNAGWGPEAVHTLSHKIGVRTHDEAELPFQLMEAAFEYGILRPEIPASFNFRPGSLAVVRQFRQLAGQGDLRGAAEVLEPAAVDIPCFPTPAGLGMLLGAAGFLPPFEEGSLR